MMENYLKKLGALLHKRERKSFKNDLRAQLLARAVELNEAPVKRGFAWPTWENAWVRRLVPATAAVLLLALVFQFVLPNGGGLLPQLVNVAEAKDYYELTPTESDATGIASDSQFLLSSKGSLSVSEVQEQLTIEPAAELEFEQVSENEVAVLPGENLDPGTVYTFALSAQNLSDSPYPKEYSWAYEVSTGFRITGTLPGNEEAGVPTNSGIEVYFTDAGVDEKEFEDAFSISPAVSGSFSVEGKTGVFAPKGGLSAGTIYTVTIAGTLALPGTDKTLGKDQVFSFEVDMDSRDTTYLNFTKDIYEFSEADTPTMQVSYWGDGDDGSPVNVGLNVYRYKSDEDFLTALQDFAEGAPEWSYYQRRYYQPSTNGLDLVLESADYELTDNDGVEFLSLPQSLPDGDYLVRITKNDAVTTAFIQVSSHAVYLNVNEASTLAWVNSVDTGLAIEDATVSLVGANLSAKTNAEGVASLENIYDKVDTENFAYSNLFFEVEADGRKTYYDAEVYLGNGPANKDYWQLLKTDRATYQPTDTVYYWGFVQGREEAIEDQAELYLMKGYYWAEFFSFPADSSDFIYKEKISLKDGEAFEGKLDIHQLSSGTYRILIRQGDELLTETDFSVEPYVKPAYDISISADKTALFEGETSMITVHAQFYEGTPVPNTEFRVQTPDGEEQTLTTDENGDIKVEWVASSSCGDCDYLYSYDYARVTPVQEELGEVSEGLSFKVFRAKTTLTNESSVENDEFTFKTVQVDLSKVDYLASAFESYDKYENIYGEPDTQSSIGLQVTQVDYVKVKTGEYYDEDDKVVRETYEYERQESTVVETTLKPNGNGEYTYAANLSEDYDYEVMATVFDRYGNSYQDNFYISNGNSYYSGTAWLELRVKGKTDYSTPELKIGEELTLEASLTDGEVLDGSFLFMEYQAGVQDYTVQDSAEYEFSFGKEDVPAVTVSTVYFNGKVYKEGGSQTIMLDTTDRKIDLSVKPNKDDYKPGEEVTLDVQASEAAQVNLYLVDEAYYELYASEFSDPLEALYSDIGSGIDFSYTSHMESRAIDEGGKGGCFVAGTQILMADGSSKNIEDIEVGDKVLTRRSAWDETLVPVQVLNTMKHTVSDYLLVNGSLGVTGEHVLFINGQWQLAEDLKIGDLLVNSEGEKVVVNSILRVHENVNVYNFETQDKHTYFANGIYVHNSKGGSRADFRDTAFFTLVQTDASGHATVKFTLPDNITQWRLSAAAVSGGDEIHAGMADAKLNVSLPLFVNPVINSTYVAGDEPSIPVRAYGDALSVGDGVTFTMTVDEKELGSVNGEVFASSYFDLGELARGGHTIATKAAGENDDDTVILKTEVLESRFSTSFISEALLSEGGQLEGSSEGRTKVTYLNNETGTVYGALLSAYYNDGDRSDEALTRVVAAEWLNEYFGEDHSVPEFSSSVYQGEDGGLALLPYADSDLALSAKMAALSPENVEANALTGYFTAVLDDADRTLTEKLIALYGLAGLNRPYLSELGYFVTNFELNTEDKLYAALAYSEFGDDLKATVLFLQVYEEIEGAEQKVLLAAVAQSIGSDLADELWDEGMEAKYDNEDYLPLEELLFAKVRLESGSQSTVSFKVNGEKIELEAGATVTRSYLPEELAALEFSDLTGEVRAVSFYQEAVNLDELDLDSRIKIERSYWVDGKEVDTLHTGDLVEVHFKVTIPSSLYGESFNITDILPSGLQTATWKDAGYMPWYNPDSEYRHPYDQNGQKLSFYASCNEKGECYNTSFYYLARIVNPGSFVLEPALLQSFENLEVLTISGERGTLTIE